MNPFYEFLSWLSGYVEKPAMYGPYHLLWLAGVFAICIVLALLPKKCKTNRFFKITLFVLWIVLVIMEILKELTISFYIEGGEPGLRYNFLYFPYQLCSLPFYVLPFIIFLKSEKIKEYFIFPMITFIFVGGLLALLIPASFQNIRYINFHTMAHHGFQVVACFVCILWIRDKITIKNFIKMIPLLLISMSLAIILNIALYAGTNTMVQLWNLSPFVVMDMEILENIRNSVGYPSYVVIYLIIIILVSLLLYLVIWFLSNIKQIFSKKQRSYEAKNNDIL